MKKRGYITPVLLIIFAFLLLLTSCPLLFAQGQMIKGNASYYADKFHGQRTASGEIYNKDSMTCAHLKYPFGTILKVRNPLNDRTVYVRVTDRGPYHKHRVIDLSRAAARELGIIQAGFSMVEITPFHTVESPYLPGDDGLPRCHQGWRGTQSAADANPLGGAFAYAVPVYLPAWTADDFEIFQ